MARRQIVDIDKEANLDGIKNGRDTKEAQYTLVNQRVFILDIDDYLHLRTKLKSIRDDEAARYAT